MSWMCFEGRTAEYLMGNGSWLLKNRTNEYLYFPKIADAETLFESKEEAYRAAMDYHETEGCALYLELYPAPEKGEYTFIAQDMDGEWCGFYEKPSSRNTTWADDACTYDVIKKSPPNPFWRKTLR